MPNETNADYLYTPCMSRAPSESDYCPPEGSQALPPESVLCTLLTDGSFVMLTVRRNEVYEFRGTNPCKSAISLAHVE